MPRQKSLLTVIRDFVQQEVRSAMQSLFGDVLTAKPAKNGRRRRRRRARRTRRRPTSPRRRLRPGRRHGAPKADS
jgi:hypothetical protein